MNGIDIRLLRAAIAISEELSFSRAAQKLRITQPALSKQIVDLEERLGIILFERDRQTVEMTEACRLFVEDARLSVLHLDRAIQKAKAASTGRENILHIGRTPYADPYLISILRSIRLPLYPSLQLEMASNFSPELARQVRTGELDLAVLQGHDSPPQLSSLEVGSAPLFVLFRIEEPLAAMTSVSLQDLTDKTWILFGRHTHPEFYESFLRDAQRTQTKPGALHHVSTAEEAAHLVTESGGFAFLTNIGAWRVLGSNLTIRPLNNKDLTLKTFLAADSNTHSRLVSEFVRAVGRKLESLRQLGQKSLPLSA